MPVDLEANDEQAPLFNAMFLAEITAVTGSSPYVYSWKEMVPDPAGTGYEDADPGRTGDADDQPAYEINDVELAVGTLVQIRCRGVQDGELRFEIDTGATSNPPTGLTVKEFDGSPSYTKITSLEIDQAQGGVVTQPALGRAKVSWADATASQAGVVSTSAQTFAGYKHFSAITSGPAFHVGAALTSPFPYAGTEEYYTITGSGYYRVGQAGSPFTGEFFGLSYADKGISWSSGTSVLFSGGRVQASTQFAVGVTDVDASCELGQTGTYAGLAVTGGIITGGSVSVDLTSDVTGSLPIANSGTGLTTTPPDGSILTGTGSGYQQSSAVTHSLRWGID
jgi:hypothetical protein